MSFASDGASVMMGENNGVAARIAKNNPYLFITHCIAHRLSLASENAYRQVDFCKKAEQIMKRCYKFFSKSSKRIDTLHGYQEFLNKPEIKICKIFDIRWLSSFEAVKNLCITLEPLLDTLVSTAAEITNTQKRDLITALYDELCNWKLLAFFHFLYDILGYIAKLSKIFQEKYIRFSDIDATINATIQKIQYEYLEQNDEGNLNLGFNLKQFIQQIPPSSPSFMGTHYLTLTENCESELMADIFRFASLVILEIQKKFPDRPLLNAMQILNPKEWPKNKEKLIKFGDTELEELIRFYGKSYLPNYSIPIIDSENIRNEWYLFKEIVYRNYQNFNIEEFFPHLFENYSTTYPNIMKLIEIIYSIPFSSVECERGFSKQNIIKTDHRNRLSNNTLHLLLLVSLDDIQIEDFDFNQALAIWLKMRNRRV